MTTLSNSPQDEICLIFIGPFFLQGGPASYLTSGDPACPKISADVSDSVEGHDYTIPVWKRGEDNYGCNDELEVVKRLTNQCCKCEKKCENQIVGGMSRKAPSTWDIFFFCKILEIKKIYQPLADCVRRTSCTI